MGSCYKETAITVTPAAIGNAIFAATELGSGICRLLLNVSKKRYLKERVGTLGSLKDGRGPV
jgi:hypothetical protein